MNRQITFHCRDVIMDSGVALITGGLRQEGAEGWVTGKGRLPSRVNGGSNKLRF